MTQKEKSAWDKELAAWNDGYNAAGDWEPPRSKATPAAKSKAVPKSKATTAAKAKATASKRGMAKNDPGR